MLGAAAAWLTQTAAAQSTLEALRSPDEEVTVVAPRSPDALRRELEQAREDLYALFNELNTDDRYDIVCKREQVLGTLIRRQVCMTVSERKAYSDAAALYVLSGAALDPTAGIANSGKELAARMVALIDGHPDLRRAVEDYARLHASYLAAHEDPTAGGSAAHRAPAASDATGP
jgi:hypothetical protein